ncbi:MAG: hypothetical protein H7256_16105 [Bdellovibrio sp.]|nr:hypothetical protein [Bdellovibrio sp.]
MRILLIKLFFVIQLVSIFASASYLKIFHTGSSKDSQTNTVSGSYSPSSSDEFLKISPWEFNASAGKTNTGVESAAFTTNQYDVGGSYHSEDSFRVSLSFSADAANSKGATTTKPSVTLEKKWTLDGSEQNANDSEDTALFDPKIGVSVGGSQRSASQKGNKTILRDFNIRQTTVDYGLSFEPYSWLALDASVSQFSYDESVSDVHTVASTLVFTNQFGYSYQNLIEGFNDKETALRLTFKLTDDTSIEISSVVSHGIALKNWTTDYTLEFSSSVFDSIGYAVGVTQSKTTDTTTTSYSGDASLSYYF